MTTQTAYPNFVTREGTIFDVVGDVNSTTGRGVIQGSFDSWDEAFVIGGQSNADGRGVMDSTAAKSSPKVLLLDKGENIVTAVEPVGEQVAGWINNTPSGTSPGVPAHSFGVAMGKSVAQLTGITPILVPCAIGSTTMQMWEVPSDPNDLTTLFGAMNSRAETAMRNGRPPVFCWSGHESNQSEVTEVLSTGKQNYIYYGRQVNQFEDIRRYYPDAPVIYAQLSTTNDGAGATSARKAAEQQRKLESDGTGDEPTLQAGALAVSGINTNATNTVTLNGSTVTMVGDGSVTLGFSVTSPAVASGKVYALRMAVSGTGRFKITDQVGNDLQIDNSAYAERDYVFLAAGTSFRIYRNTAGQATNLTFTVSGIYEMTTFQKPNNYMVVAHDLPRNAGADNQHISTEGNKELGRRFALAYAERVLELPGVDGTGPRLVSVTSTDATHTKVKFTQDIAAAKAGETNYSDGTDSLLRVYDAGTEKAVSSVAIDGADSTALIITHAACAGVRVVTYGDRAGQNAAWRKGVIYNTLDAPLPAPMFGPVVSV